jgi:hypothetical protein
MTFRDAEEACGVVPLTGLVLAPRAHCQFLFVAVACCFTNEGWPVAQCYWLHALAGPGGCSSAPPLRSSSEGPFNENQQQRQG